MSIEESIKLKKHNDDIVIMEWDMIGEKVNKLSTPMMVRLRELLEEIKQSSYKAIVVISRKKDMFIAGADIEEIKNLKTKEEYMKALVPAQEVFNLLEDMPQTSIAAIHGPCLGGGCEMILACNYRICSDDKKTKIGLPETKLGIIPGFGGCVRLPRVVGLQASLDIILAGKAVPGQKALKIGLVDECVPQGILEQRALIIAQEVVSGQREQKRQKRFKSKGLMNGILETMPGKMMVFSQAKKQVMKSTKGFYPAPLKALSVVQKTYMSSNRDKSLSVEREGFVEVAVTEISKYLIDLFYMLEAVKKKTGVADASIKPLPVDHVGVLGAGTMGGGIAQVAADKGIYVRLKDINNEALAIGYKAARDVWQKQVKRRRMNEYELKQKMSHISGGLDYSGFKQLDVVIEAIVEDMNIKQKVIADTANHCRDNCVIATNTSSLSVAEMAKAHPHPKNFVGMHFFNPVHKMPLVEVIRGPETSDEATATIFELAKRMGKTPVVVKDGPGFLVNRLLVPYMIEAIFLLEEGMAIDVLDRYYTHKFGMPMGPFRLMDEVGLDVAMKILKIFKSSLGERIQVPEVSKNIVGNDRLGCKNRKGFYLYDERGRETQVDASIYRDLGLKPPTNPLSEKECLQRGMFSMINEAAMTLLQDRIVETPQEVDLAMIMGTGFPPFRGGLLKYADSIGAETIVQELELYAAKHGVRFKPTQSLVHLANQKKKFYS